MIFCLFTCNLKLWTMAFNVSTISFDAKNGSFVHVACSGLATIVDNWGPNIQYLCSQTLKTTDLERN